MSYRAIVIAGLATVSPEEHSLIIRDVPPDEPGQFRIRWWQGNNQLTYRDNAKKELFHRIVSIFYAITIFGLLFHEIVLLSHRQFSCKIFEYPQNVFF